MRDSIRELADGSIRLRIRVDERVHWLEKRILSGWHRGRDSINSNITQGICWLVLGLAGTTKKSSIVPLNNCNADDMSRNALDARYVNSWKMASEDGTLWKPLQTMMWYNDNNSCTVPKFARVPAISRQETNHTNELQSSPLSARSPCPLEVSRIHSSSSGAFKLGLM